LPYNGFSKFKINNETLAPLEQMLNPVCRGILIYLENITIENTMKHGAFALYVQMLHFP
jgi:hypothetical protein